MSEVDLHNYGRRYRRNLEMIEGDKRICEENKEDIVAFAKMRLAKGSGYGRVAKVLYCLRNMAVWIKKPFRKATKDDLVALVGDLETKGFSDHTKYDFKIVLKLYYKWLKGNDEDTPAIIKWLRPKLKNSKQKLPEELLTEDEVLRMAETADNERDRAFVLVLYESGCRIGEILSLQLKNISFDQFGTVIRVTGKTGDRRVRLVSSSSTLASWINVHPLKNEPDAMIWHSRWGMRRNRIKCLSHTTIHQMLRNLAKKAGVKKKVYPHLFRHSRATSLASKLTEAQMKEHFGWVQESEMAATYVHLSGRDVDDALLKLHGLVRQNNSKEEKLRVQVCQRCKENNSPLSKFCNRCGLPLSEDMIAVIEKERKASDNIMNKLMEDKEFKELMMRKIFEMGLEKNYM